VILASTSLAILVATTQLWVIKIAISRLLSANFAFTAENIRAVEAGRRLARDLGGPDPERMAPGRYADLS
jgi:hypothetical protein